MTADIITLPVIRKFNSGHTIIRQISIDWPIDDNLRVAAKMAKCNPEQLIEALICYGLAKINKVPIEGFLLAAEVEAAKQRDFGDRTDSPTAQRLPELT